jgi:sugar lactone lactonase YvrE
VDNEEEHTKQVEHAQVTTRLESEEIVDNNQEQVEQIERVEHHEKSQPLTDLNLPNDMKVSRAGNFYTTRENDTNTTQINR